MEPKTTLGPLKNEIEFKDGVPVSLLFDDVYFSKQGGWEESSYVFLEGNQIPSKLAKKGHSIFYVGELGFGSGLNLFVTLDFWKSIPSPPQVTFMSLEGFPLKRDILLTLNKSYPDKKLWSEDLLSSYESAINLWTKDPTQNLWTYTWNHSSNQSTFTLQVFFGDVRLSLPQFLKIHSWYLDGFSPGKNPDMWSLDTLKEIQKKSNPGTSFATFSSAGFLRRNLTELGFVVDKKKGFGRKREMIFGFLK
ncbi:tRNA (5-methylaminomethyl-2-thiouridine)(34)-methyltransferase MnmD [Leptospira sp. 2 VSF19]|uniref:tRNA (5-methylaminomethyl-2-thiouridine)(34)-methyltransferase MnmD n=1 Tax=Leptospira soteropolitanensis TaxID=2950025 RepID=A0AAW5VFB9_9LEPT|nr:tRNA (5-methylaminomethyl-2-thiouridine)(34)-methyltransferase MnmD [Leptospira soteropolitanensis]MCW7493938.1 tRNA (5-methylaminomethyl-2-thiouridine)(34)-methyltransferase MnmD [Leptospira soteropolitanensis]MCW7501532.1 tRNA (5-methylaminomethyl-2-thiouridine)(34)-methyltransferase MnmD [Leptospira soteropolitanensis]MCW7523706.1 tRNA (5-methylaminomethyl-2-thiouridine)(34)-methyltransferase MnmD [Leptospira soteropolitanensis]MCW7527569.1 tRNA (5-methylaminomethyl-2-thiouridine)(34)-met